MSESTSVYRVYGDGWQLLYVGCSGDVHKRLQQHRYTGSPWVEKMVHVRIRVYPTRKEALRVEDRAMRILKPQYCGLHPLRKAKLAREEVAKGKGEMAELAREVLEMPNVKGTTETVL